MDRALKGLGGLVFWILSTSSAWAVPVKALSDAAWEADPAGAQQVLQAQPLVTRSGLMRFGPEAVDGPAAAAVLAMTFAVTVAAVGAA